MEGEMANITKDKIVFFLLNYLALEGAREHFGEQLPDDNAEIEKHYAQIKELTFPGAWDAIQQIYDYTGLEITGDTKCEKCWNCLRVIRNNLFHANKAVLPDTIERLDALLDWSKSFIGELLKADHGIGRQAQEIKLIMRID
jgi:hypothetical protein